MSYSFKLPYGLREEEGFERLIHISEIKPNESGLRCKCVCPNCGARLQARLPKTKVDFTPRFAHHNADTCDYATETALHMKAKEIIEKEKRMVIPGVTAIYNSLYKDISSEREVTFDRVVLERHVGSIIPDVLAYKENHPLMIEITITHGIDDIKFEKIEKLGISTLEIDLSGMDTNFDPELLYTEIILNTQNKYWIYNKVEEQEKLKLKEQYELELIKQQEKKRKAEEKKKWFEKINEEKRKGKPDRIKQLLDPNFQVDLKRTWEIKMNNDPIWSRASKALKISASTIPTYINVEIPGEIVFGCYRRVWQAYIFSKYVNNKVKLYMDKTYPISVKRIQADVKKVFKEHLIYDLVYLDDMKEFNDVPDLTKVIYDYLVILGKYGYLAEQEAGHIFHTKFVVLDPESIYEMRYVPTSLPEYKEIEALLKNRNWVECKKLIQELLIKYGQINQIDYFERLSYLFDGVVFESEGRSRTEY